MYAKRASRCSRVASFATLATHRFTRAAVKLYSLSCYPHAFFANKRSGQKNGPRHRGPRPKQRRMQRHTAWEGGGAVAPFDPNYANIECNFCEAGHSLVQAVAAKACLNIVSQKCRSAEDQLTMPIKKGALARPSEGRVIMRRDSGGEGVCIAHTSISNVCATF